MPKHDLVLLALDDVTILQLMQRALQAVSYETAVASDRVALEKIVQEAIPALVMLGEKFDGQLGVKIAREILERFPTMPILIYAERESVVLYKEVLQAGLSGCIYPPLRNDDIIGAVERSLQRARALGDWLRREVKRTTASLERRANLSEIELQRYEFIFANIDDGVIILDEAGKIQLMNKAMLVAFDLSDKGYQGKPVLEIIDHPDVSVLLNRAQMAPLKYHEINFDDGRIYNAQYTPLEGIGSVITVQDISYLKQVDRMKSDFVHTVSHDLRSPLTSVLGYTELVGRVGPLNEQQIEFLNRIRSSVESITSLVNELLDLSRLEAGFDTRHEIVQLENILKFALDTLEGQFRLNNLSLQSDIAEDLPEMRGNPIRLRQLLDNLLTNAAKYAPPGTAIRISLQAEDNLIIFSVADEGPGIPQSEQGRIFEKFYRASNVPEQVGGSGLGLAIVKSIVDSHQGRIWVESVVGKGSTFFVVLPAYIPEKSS
ncbi:MAG: response regulator [Anaerolineales bacterium]|nr:response regulator [Anaerolineales bacterium]